MGLRPAFCDKVNGIISKESAKARTQCYSAPFNVLENWANFYESSISIAPPPGIIPRFFTRHLTTHRAS